MMELQVPGLEVFTVSPREGKDKSHKQSLLHTSLLGMTEMEESETEGSAQCVNNGLRHRWSSQM